MVVAVVACSGAVVAAIDLRTRRVPNAITGALAVTGLAHSASGMSGHSPAAAVGGMVLAFVLMLPGHLFGATGAGDVKLFAAMGTLLGPAAVITAFLYTAISGGLLAIAVAAGRRRLTQTVTGVAGLVASGGANAHEIKAPARHNRFAYAPAFAIGALLAALGV
jgi:prepilin peptidase CpaA